MRLDHTLHPGGVGKYSVIDNRTGKVVENSGIGEENEFFVIMLKDIHAVPALGAYAASAIHTDDEYATEIHNLMLRAGRNSKFCKEPD